MTVLDERGEPVVVERVGLRRYLASGWWGGVGRYAASSTANHARWLWIKRRFLPKRQRPSDERPGERPEGVEEDR